MCAPVLGPEDEVVGALSISGPTDRMRGDRSSFSLTVNHRDTFTGAVDNDRARTILVLRSPSGRTVTDVDLISHT